ncbi:MAG: hypothetical protein HZB16_09890 [Armatimonadetes bacterium]|nr:hypothetical protein [Armatimonadota bacterium]
MGTAFALLLILTAIWCLSAPIEALVLLLALSRRHSWRRRLFAGVWLSACILPLWMLAAPFVEHPAITALFGVVDFRGSVMDPSVLAGLLAMAVAKCELFWVAFDRDAPPASPQVAQDMIAVLLASALPILVGGCLIGG